MEAAAKYGYMPAQLQILSDGHAAVMRSWRWTRGTSGAKSKLEDAVEQLVCSPGYIYLKRFPMKSSESVARQCTMCPLWGLSKREARRAIEATTPSAAASAFSRRAFAFKVCGRC